MTGMTISAPQIPMDCLTEHLDYFNENVAAEIQFSVSNFDDIFTKNFADSAMVYTALPDVTFDEPWEVQPVAKKLKSGIVRVNHETYEAVPASTAVARQVTAQSLRDELEPIPFEHYKDSMYARPVTHQPEQQVYSAAPMAGSSGGGIKHAFQHMYPPSQHCDHEKMKLMTQTPSSPRSVKNFALPSREEAVASPTTIVGMLEGSKTLSTKTPCTSQAAYSKLSGRKRSPSVVSVNSIEKDDKEEPIDTTGMSLEELEKLRRERNRHHAKRSRQRKRNYTSQLEDAVNEMKRENERLCQMLGVDSSRAKLTLAHQDVKRQELATEKFIKHLTRPSNRMLDNTTLSFLRELWR